MTSILKSLPAIHNWSKDPNRIKDGEKQSQKTSLYSSDNNKEWMNADELAEWIEKNKDKIGLI